MAPKSKSRLVEEPPSASSSEEQEQVEESQEEQESEEEQQQEQEQEQSDEEQESEEEEPKTAPVVKKPTISKTPQKTQSSSSESGSGSDSESDSGQSQQPSPSASDFTVKPSAPVPTKVPAKRPQETQEKAQKDSRRLKKPKIAEEQEDKKALSSVSTPNRLWNDEDQIAVLKGMAEFKAQKGIEPNSDMSAFHDFVKGKLQVEVSKSQLSDKVRRLKKKFFTHVKNGGDPVFPKPHDYLVFEYSKKIWGSGGKADSNAGTSNGVSESVVNANGKAKKTAPVEVKKGSESKKSAKVSTKPKDVEKPKEDEKVKDVAVKEVVKEDVVKGGDRQDFQSKYPHLAASFDLPAVYPSASDMLKKNMSLIDGDKAKVLEEKWKKLHDAEADLMLKRLDLVREHYKLVVDAMREIVEDYSVELINIADDQ